MAYVQLIKVPFVSAFSIDNYAESLTFGLAPSGEYIEAGYAVDSFTGYLTGFNRFFSGSGYWLTSGSSFPISQFLNDSFSGYSSGDYRYNALNAGFIYQGFTQISGVVSGNLYLLDNYLTDSFTTYNTGAYTGSVLTGNTWQSYYSQYTGSSSGIVTPIGQYYANSGLLTNSWFISNITSISNQQPFAGANSYLSNQASYAIMPYDSSFLLGDYTVEMWLNRGVIDNTSDVFVENESSSTNGLRLLGISTTPNKAYYYNNGALVVNSGTVPSGSWFHVAATRSTGNAATATPSGMNLYFSGILSANNPTATISQLTGLLSSTSNITIGALTTNPESSASVFTGYWAEFRLWNYTRSQSQIQSTMNTKITPGSQTGLLLYLSF